MQKIDYFSKFFKLKNDYPSVISTVSRLIYVPNTEERAVERKIGPVHGERFANNSTVLCTGQFAAPFIVKFYFLSWCCETFPRLRQVF